MSENQTERAYDVIPKPVLPVSCNNRIAATGSFWRQVSQLSVLGSLARWEDSEFNRNSCKARREFVTGSTTERESDKTYETKLIDSVRNIKTFF